ncbi:MAG: hypothetical protein HW421_2122 [Ignavibacteria bacterium]|nr:hypothetical protein [Ignavibacteria bacterium]
MKKIIITSLAILFLVCACKENSSTPSGSSNEIIPLKIGNIWNFKISEYDSKGNIINTSEMTYYVFKDSVIEGIKAYCMKFTTPFSEEISEYTYNKPDGYYTTYTIEGKVYHDWMYKYPGSAGDLFQSGEYTIKILSISESVSTPAGTFKCYKYHNIVELPSFVFLCPDVGPVKMEHYDYDNNGKLFLDARMELVSYTLK